MPDAAARQRIGHPAWWLLAAAAGAGVAAYVVLRRRRAEASSGTWRWSPRAPFRVNEVPAELARIGVAPGLSVLEVGCGPGVYTEEAARIAGRGGSMRALEADPALAAVARSRLSAQGLDVAVENAEPTRLPYADATFDLAYLVTQLGRIRERDRALRELRRVLKPGGRLAISEHLADPGYLPASIVQRSCLEAGFEPGEVGGGARDRTSAFRKPAVLA
ncbi:MAG: methyltransferase domain-containing protein [Candidatus Dormiibacterota bacterium]